MPIRNSHASSGRQDNNNRARLLNESLSRKTEPPLEVPNPVITDPSPKNWNYIIASALGTVNLAIALIVYLGHKDNTPPVVSTKVLGLVGVHTTYLSADRRAALRSTWFPAHIDAHLRLQTETCLAFRFVIGKNENGARRREIEEENQKYDDIIILKVGEKAGRLKKTLAFFKAASEKFQAEYYIRADDDIYLRPDRLATLLSRKMTKPLEYIGCKTCIPLKRKKKLVFGHGSIYILSAKALEPLAKTRLSASIKSCSDDFGIGYVMDMVNVKLEEQRDLCHSQCTHTSIAVWNFTCPTGPCNPVTMLRELHNSVMCSKTPTIHSEQLYMNQYTNIQ